MDTTTAIKNVGFQDIDLRKFQCPLIAVFKNTVDYPDKYVARLFDLNRPINAMEIGDTLEGIRAKLPKYMFCLAPDSKDHPTVVETWI